MKKRAEQARYSFPGALGGGRTHTGRILSPLPLPLGYEGGSCAEQSTRELVVLNAFSETMIRSIPLQFATEFTDFCIFVDDYMFNFCHSSKIFNCLK